jgi:RNA polymerase sigma-70 factor (ECF subfamily)
MPEFAELVEKEIPRLRRYARALCKSSSTQADDLVQDTLLRGIAKQHLWKEGTNLRAWLFTLMHNQFVNNIRHSAREGTAINIEDVSRPMVAVSDPSAPLQLRDLERALGQLPVEQHQVRYSRYRPALYVRACHAVAISCGSCWACTTRMTFRF